MQKSFDLRTANADDFGELKKLWSSCFDDPTEVIDAFFEKTVTPENVVAVFDGNEAVSSAYLLESEIKIDGVKHKAFYVYAVCTEKRYRSKGLMRNVLAFCEKSARERNADYIFLVPANDGLFEMYKKIGFEVGFTFKEEIVEKRGFSSDCDSSACNRTVELTYERYLSFRGNFPENTALASLKEKAFDSFYFPVGESVVCLCNGNGYAVYESENGNVTVHELFGDEKSLLNSVFESSGKDKLTLRKPSPCGDGVPFGMYRALGNVPKIKDAFFGIPYGV